MKPNIAKHPYGRSITFQTPLELRIFNSFIYYIISKQLMYVYNSIRIFIHIIYIIHFSNAVFDGIDKRDVYALLVLSTKKNGVIDFAPK